MTSLPRVCVVVAIGSGPRYPRVIGRDNKLIWHIPEDLKRFKELTLGHPVIMGRKTFESIVAAIGKPLPDRPNIVVTRDPEWHFEGVTVTYSLEEALSLARTLDSEEVHIGGGAELYKEALPYIDRLYLTIIEDDKEGDTFFPPYEHEFTKVVTPEEWHDWKGLRYRYVTLERA